MKLLNQRLYDRLTIVTKDNVGVHKEGESLVYEIRGSSTKFFKRYAAKKYPFVLDWGETYTVNCPICGDTRQRLSIGHASCCMIKDGRNHLQIPTLMKCFNEDCTKQNLYKILDWMQGNFEAIDITKTKPKRKKSLDIIKTIDRKELPKLFAIKEGIFSSLEKEYVTKLRGWSIDLLHKYHCSFVAKDTVYGKTSEDTEETKRMFFENRLFIPIIQGKVMVSWQARVLRAHDKSFKYKYIFPPGCKKTNYIYNMDSALFHRDIIICEGTTDVWHIGDNSIALFGKYLSPSQMDIMSKLWGFDGQAVIMLDSDAYKEAKQMKIKLEKYKIFPRGVGIVKLPGGDPADLNKKELDKLVSNCRDNINKGKQNER